MADLLVQRGVTVSYEVIRQWCRTFGWEYARTLRRRRGRMGNTWDLFVTTQGRRGICEVLLTRTWAFSCSELFTTGCSQRARSASGMR